jgi:hypothetical protein
MDADGNIWAIVPVKETAAAKQRLAGLLVAGARRQLALAMLADVLQAIAGVPELAGIVAVTVDPDAATSLCAPASRHGARRIAMVTPARSWPRTCRSRTAKKFEIDKPGMHTTDTVDYGIVPDARSGWSSTTASKSIFGRTTWSSRTPLAMRGETRGTGPSRWLSC